MGTELHVVMHYYPKGSYVVNLCKSVAGDYEGFLYYPNIAKKCAFLSLWGLIRQMEADIESTQYPQNTFELRRWSKSKTTKKPRELRLKNEKTGESFCSFLVQVQYCRNATWQGTIHWMEGKQTRSFRSEYELLKLIEEAAKSKSHKPTRPSAGE